MVNSTKDNPASEADSYLTGQKSSVPYLIKSFNSTLKTIL